MQDYKPNSHRFKEEEKNNPPAERKVQKVTKGKVKTKKKSEASKIADIFVAEDVSNVKSYIFMDVLVPAIKKAISDIVTDGVDMILYGSTKKGKKDSTYVSYRDYSNKDNRKSSSARVNSRFDFEELIFESRGEAEAVRDQMDDMIDRYGIVSVADMYDAAGLSAPYTANKYGWTNIRNCEAVRVRDGYILKLSKPMPIDY